MASKHYTDTEFLDALEESGGWISIVGKLQGFQEKQRMGWSVGAGGVQTEGGHPSLRDALDQWFESREFMKTFSEEEYR